MLAIGNCLLEKEFAPNADKAIDSLSVGAGMAQW